MLRRRCVHACMRLSAHSLNTHMFRINFYLLEIENVTLMPHEMDARIRNYWRKWMNKYSMPKLNYYFYFSALVFVIDIN